MLREPHAVLGAVEDEPGGGHAACVYFDHVWLAPKRGETNVSNSATKPFCARTRSPPANAWISGSWSIQYNTPRGGAAHRTPLRLGEEQRPATRGRFVIAHATTERWLTRVRLSEQASHSLG